MMVKLTQDLARGFKPWKDMFHENEAALNALGGKLVFAGTEKDNDILRVTEDPRFGGLTSKFKATQVSA